MLKVKLIWLQLIFSFIQLLLLLKVNFLFPHQLVYKFLLLIYNQELKLIGKYFKLQKPSL
jgi:hypothetical protein